MLHLGCRRCVIIGMDHSSQPQHTLTSGGLAAAADANHFDANYVSAALPLTAQPLSASRSFDGGMQLASFEFTIMCSCSFAPSMASHCAAGQCWPALLRARFADVRSVVRDDACSVTFASRFWVSIILGFYCLRFVGTTLQSAPGLIWAGKLLTRQWAEDALCLSGRWIGATKCWR